MLQWRMEEKRLVSIDSSSPGLSLVELSCPLIMIKQSSQSIMGKQSIRFKPPQTTNTSHDTIGFNLKNSNTRLFDAIKL